MAKDTKKSNVESMIDTMDGDATEQETPRVEEPSEPSWRMYADARIPVARSLGALFKMRKQVAVARFKKQKTYDAWDEAIAYYKNDQSGKRIRHDGDNPGGGAEENVSGGAFSHTENLVFANASALVPAIYAKNPDVSVSTGKGEEERQFAECAQKLIRTLLQKRTNPGVNLKPKVRRAVVMSTLCNISYIEVGYTRKEQSSEVVLEEIDNLAKQLKEAKSPDEIEAIEGKLNGLNDKVDLLSPSGPWTKYRHPKDVIVDPDAMSPDLTDAKWVMIRDIVDTSFINAVYREKDEKGNYRNIYKPTHVLRQDTSDRSMAGHDIEINSFSLLDEEGDKSYRDYGYDDDATFERAKRTIVWYVWDRTTRRQFMFADNDWTWPIWVWDDPYGLDEFFPLYPLAFHTDPEDMYARGEVSYYLDQQDEINMINSQIKRMRHRVSNTLVYNKSVIKDEGTVRAIIEPSSRQSTNILGIEIPPDMDLRQHIVAPPIPSLDHPQLFDKANLLDAIDRISGVSTVLKGVEYKTNTTNRAIESYESSSQLRLDEKIDAIEELIGRIGNALLVMCLQFMDNSDVVKLIGQQHASYWPPQMAAREAQESFELTVIGGSSLKPTSKVRKEHAMELGQILGQFASASPVALLIAMRVISRAFSDEFDVEKNDWDMLMQSFEQMIAGQQQAGPEGQGAPPQGAAPEQNGGGMRQMIEQLDQALQQMPPELRQEIGQALGEGAPLMQIMEQLAQQQQPN